MSFSRADGREQPPALEWQNGNAPAEAEARLREVRSPITSTQTQYITRRVCVRASPSLS